MKIKLFYFGLFMIIFMLTGLLLNVSAEITPDQYFFIDTHIRIEGERDDGGFMYIDFPEYNYNTSYKTLDSYLPLSLTEETKVILGEGTSLGGSVGSGAATWLSLFNNLTEPDKFSIDEIGYLDYNLNGEWISVGPGETWTRTLETASYFGITGNLIVTETIKNLGIWEKIKISHPGKTPEPFRIIGDVNLDGSVDVIDALLTAQYFVGLDPQGFHPDVADVNCDTSIDILDALLIAQYYVGIITEFCEDSFIQ